MKNARCGLIGAMLLALAACTTQAGPTYTIRAIDLPDKAGTAFRVTCEGLLTTTKQCRAAASKFCGKQGVTLLQAIDRVSGGKPKLDPRELTFQCGVPESHPQSAPAAPPVLPVLPPPPPPVVKREMLLQGSTEFAFDSAALTNEARRKLDRFLAINRNNTFARATVIGYTDSTGTRAHNFALSEARARSAAQYLHSGGLNARQVVVTGAGPDHPVASNASAAGRAMNRRVEIELEAPTDQTTR